MAVRRRSALTLVLLLLSLAASCSRARSSDATSEYEALALRYQGQSGVVTFPELAEDLGYLSPLELVYVGNTISGPQDIQTVATGDIEFGLAFNGALLKLLAARAPIKAVVGGYGIDQQTFSSFLVREESQIRSVRDLIGKQVAVNTLGAHSEFVLREQLRRQGLSETEAKKVTLVVLPPVNTEQSLREKQVDAAALIGIFRDKALERGGLRQLFSDYELFGEFTAGSYAFHRSFVEKHPRTVRKFVDGVARAIEWARSAPRETVIARHEAIIRRRKRNENTALVKHWKSTGIAGKGGLIAERELQIWLDWLVRDKELAPGQLVLSEVYTNEFNPFRRVARP